MMEFLVANYAVLIPLVLGLGWLIVRWTPTEKDDKVWAFVENIIKALLTDNKKGGGKHNG